MKRINYNKGIHRKEYLYIPPIVFQRIDEAKQEKEIIRKTLKQGKSFFTEEMLTPKIVVTYQSKV